MNRAQTAQMSHFVEVDTEVYELFGLAHVGQEMRVSETPFSSFRRPPGLWCGLLCLQPEYSSLIAQHRLVHAGPRLCSAMRAPVLCKGCEGCQLSLHDDVSSQA